MYFPIDKTGLTALRGSRIASPHNQITLGLIRKYYGPTFNRQNFVWPGNDWHQTICPSPWAKLQQNFNNTSATFQQIYNGPDTCFSIAKVMVSCYNRRIYACRLASLFRIRFAAYSRRNYVRLQQISCDFQTILMIAEVQACDGSGAAPTRRPTGVA